MALNVATNVALRTYDELTALVTAVAEALPGTQETNWIEWKIGLDLDSPAGKFAVAKAILGFANRAPQVAAQNCQGVAYMIVGAEPGNVAGIAPRDHATLSQKIRTYAVGPRWSAEDIDYQGKNVLVLIVEAPTNGDRIHTLQKTLDSAYAGTVYHRGLAETQPASHQDVDMLQERLLRGTQQPDLNLDLSAIADTVNTLEASAGEVESWLKRHEAFVRANSGRPADPPPSASWPGGPEFSRIGDDLGGLLSSGAYATPEDAAEFDRRVRKYMTSVRSGLRKRVVRKIVQSDSNKVRFIVANNSDDSVRGVQLVARIPDSLRVFDSPPSVKPLPSPPRWPTSMDRFGAAGPPMPAISSFDLAHSTASIVEQNDHIEITWDIGDLRPGERCDPCTITIIAAADLPDDDIEIEIVARAMDRRGTQKATTELKLSCGTWTLDDFLDPQPSR